MIIHKEMDLFEAPKGSILVHSVNCRGIWGAGIAKTFAEKCPHAYLKYLYLCKNWKEDALIGLSSLHHDNVSGFDVGCLFTSRGYGRDKDSVEEILINTKEAIIDFMNEFDIYKGFSVSSSNRVTIYCNKFNSGLFGVRWALTETLLEEILENYPHFDWIVCSPK